MIRASNNPTECTPVRLAQSLGEFASLAALQAAHPTAAAGSYAVVNVADGDDLVYYFSVSDNAWFTHSGGPITPPNLQTVVTQGGEVISADGLKKVEIVKDSGQIKISTRPTTGDAWVERSRIQDNAFAQSNVDGTLTSQLLHDMFTFQNPNTGSNTEYRYDRIVNSLDDFNVVECLLPTASNTSFLGSAPQKLALKPILNSEDFTAELGVDYETDQDLTVGDPDDQIGSYRVFVSNNTATIGGVAYPKGSRIYRYYDGTAWHTVQFIDKDYVDTEINNAVAGLLDDRGNHNASSNLFPSTGGSGSGGAILKGDLWTISVAGTLGGVAVTVGDVVRALVDTPGQTATNWVVTENNIGYVPENNNNKTDVMSGNTASSVKFLSAKGVYDWVIGLGYATLSAVTSALALKVDKSRFVFQGKASFTGATGETNICSFKIPAGAYASTDGFMFDMTKDKSTTAATITYTAYFGATSGARTNKLMQSSITGANTRAHDNRPCFINSNLLETAAPRNTNTQSGLSSFNNTDVALPFDNSNDIWCTITASGQTISETIGILGAAITPM